MISNKRNLLTACCALGGMLMLPYGAQAALPAQGVSVITGADYQASSDGPNTSTDGNPGSANSRSEAGPGGSGIGQISLPGQPMVDSYDAAIAEGRSLLPGTIGSYAHAGGFSPSASGPVTASTSSASVTHWVATSSDPGITSVGIDVLAFYDGTLVTANYAGAGLGQLYASVGAQLNAYNAGGAIYNFALDATLDTAAGLSASAGWVADFDSASSGVVRQSTLNYNDFFEDAFTVNIGEVFAWESVLDTYAFAAGPFELWAVADFLNTADFGLSVNTAGVTLTAVPQVVPVPAAVWLFGSSLLGLVGITRRRRRATASV